MPISIRIISSPDGESIAEWNKAFPEEGGVIGRAYGVTMQLSDARREVSSKHAVINKTHRGYQVADYSTNGLFINGSSRALGKGNQSVLNDGDVLDVGRYRLLVSCFIPEQARAQEFSEASSDGHGAFSDDPFSHGNDAEFGPADPKEMEGLYAAVSQDDSTKYGSFSEGTARNSDVVEEDPFQVTTKVKATQHHEFNMNFSALDDDPLAESDFSSTFPVSADNEPTPATISTTQDRSMAQFRSSEARMQQQMDKALEMALNRLLMDISPQALESMFDDLMAPRFWQSKPKYWDMYKRYFSRQMDNHDWQIKFQAYFQDAMRLQRSMEGENS